MLALLLLPTASATWSIIAVDPETEEVGMAGATCGPFVWGIAGLAPGHGVVAAQYATWVKGRKQAVDLLSQGQSPEEALDAVLEADEDDAIRQWALLSLDGAPVGFTGDEVEEPAAIQSGELWSVQGNTLASEAVVEASAAAFEAAEGALDERLLAALQAGAAEGGDHRCDPQDAAKSAFVYVALPEDRAREPSVEIRASGRGAVDELARKYAEGRRSCGLGGEAAPWAWVLALVVWGRRRS